MGLGPHEEVDEDPGLHEPDTIGIALLDGLDHSLAAATEVLRLHGFGLPRIDYADIRPFP